MSQGWQNCQWILQWVALAAVKRTELIWWNNLLQAWEAEALHLLWEVLSKHSTGKRAGYPPAAPPMTFRERPSVSWKTSSTLTRVLLYQAAQKRPIHWDLLLSQHLLPWSRSFPGQHHKAQQQITLGTRNWAWSNPWQPIKTTLRNELLTTNIIQVQFCSQGFWAGSHSRYLITSLYLLIR